MTPDPLLLTNIAAIAFSAGVLVQSIRMLRSIEALKRTDLAAAAQSLDRSTAAANRVLMELRETLARTGEASARALADGAAMREELIVMVGIADAVAERLANAASPAPVPDSCADTEEGGVREAA